MINNNLKIVFVRHAQSECNRDGIWAGITDCSLSDKGINDTKEIAGVINNKYKFDIVYCSKLKRTKETLNIILPNVKAIYDDRIIEINMGDWEGIYKSSIEEELNTKYKIGTYTPPHGESVIDVDKRVSSFVEDLFNKYNNKTILVVTHNGVIRSVKRLFFKETDTNNLNSLKSKNLDIIEINKDNYNYYIEKKAK